MKNKGIEVFDNTLEGVVEQLLEYKSKGILAFAKGNGGIIYSDEISSLDDAYIKLYGYNREEYMKIREENNKKFKEEEQRKTKEKTEKAEKNIDGWIADLHNIKKEKLDERVFYEEVIKVIIKMKDSHLTPELHEKLQLVLKDIGCENIDDWKKKKIENFQIDEAKTSIMEKGIDDAELGWGVNIVNFLAYNNYENYLAFKEYMLDGKIAEDWLANSQLLRKSKTKLDYKLLQKIKKAKESIGDLEKTITEKDVKQEEKGEISEEELDEFEKKTSIIGRISKLAKRRRELKEKIKEEKTNEINEK